MGRVMEVKTEPHVKRILKESIVGKGGTDPHSRTLRNQHWNQGKSYPLRNTVHVLGLACIISIHRKLIPYTLIQSGWRFQSSTEHTSIKVSVFFMSYAKKPVFQAITGPNRELTEMYLEKTSSTQKSHTLATYYSHTALMLTENFRDPPLPFGKFWTFTQRINQGKKKKIHRFT